MGTCVHTPQPTSTPCTDTDNDLCTTSGCNGTLATGGTVVNGCDQNHMVTTCADDNNPCTGPGVCNPMTGICAFPNLPDSTPCPDTDNDPCTTAGCDPNGVCDQAHIMCTTTTTTTIATTTTTSTTTATTTTTMPCVPTGPEAGRRHRRSPCPTRSQASSSALSVMFLTPASAWLTGQLALASAAAAWKSSSDRPGTGSAWTRPCPSPRTCWIA